MTTREAIFKAGTKLFAERTYDSVGIRDIAKEADANSAMISYYFKGKAGLLQEIFSAFSQCLLDVTKSCMLEAETLDELCRITVERLLHDARQNRDLYQVGLRMFNAGNEALQELQQALRDSSQEYFNVFLQRTRMHDTRTTEVKVITFTAILGIIFSDYLLGGGSFIEDDHTAEIYTRSIVGIISSGIDSMWD